MIEPIQLLLVIILIETVQTGLILGLFSITRKKVKESEAISRKMARPARK